MLILIVFTHGIELYQHGIFHYDAAVTFALFIPLIHNLIGVKFMHEELKTLGFDERIFDLEQILDLIDYCWKLVDL